MPADQVNMNLGTSVSGATKHTFEVPPYMNSSGSSDTRRKHHDLGKKSLAYASDWSGGS